MERFQEELAAAKQKWKIADHMIFMTYPLVKDNKLLLAVLENIFLALTHAMSAVLWYERTYKRIPPFNEASFESKFSMFRNRCVTRLKIDPSYVTLITDIRELVSEHKKSPVEFARKDKFVICSSGYDMKTITIDQIKRHISTTRSFIACAEALIEKHEGIARPGH